jgi:peptidoglycan hydrolase-like protein with peptidoglycan-binding domain
MKRSNVAWLVLIFCLLGSASVSAFDQSLADLQQRLVELGYDPGPVDGLPGSRTTNALRQLQEDSGLEVTGTPDQMLVALRGYSPGEPEVSSRSGSDALVIITNGRGIFSSFSQDTSLYVAVDGRANTGAKS